MFGNIYHNKKVLVTGHTGFKGAWLSTWLLELGAEVHGLANGIPTQPSLYEVLNLGSKLQHHEADIRDLALVKKIVQNVRPDFIFHLAAQSIVKISLDNPLGTLTTNLLGHAHLLEAVRELRFPCTMVMITSDKCYENQERHAGYCETDLLGAADPYGASKAAAEIVVRAWQRAFFAEKDCPIRIATARAGNVIGGGDWAEGRLVPDCIRAWADGRPVHLRKPHATRPWQHVLEPLGGYLRLGQMLSLQPELNGEAFNFGPMPDQDRTVLDLVSNLSMHWHLPSKLENIIVDENEAFHEANLLGLNCEKAAQMLGWEPVLRFEESAALTSDWYQTFYKNTAYNMLEFTKLQYAAYMNTALSREAKWANFQ